MEINGNVYECLKCGEVWSFEDDACPNCGEQEEIETRVKLKGVN